jgi:hypothetical protein
MMCVLPCVCCLVMLFEQQQGQVKDGRKVVADVLTWATHEELLGLVQSLVPRMRNAS